MLTIGICWFQPSLGQIDSAGSNLRNLYQQMDSRVLGSLTNSYCRIEKKLLDYSERALAKVGQRENRLKERLKRKDSLRAQVLFIDPAKQYSRLIEQLKGADRLIDKVKANTQEYIPGLDSLQTCFAFLEKSGLSIRGISIEKLRAIIIISEQLKKLQTDFTVTANIQSFLKAREVTLRTELGKYGFSKELKKFNSEVYYYQQQLNEYKGLIKDRTKLERKLIATVREQPLFKDFMAKNSQLSQFFQLPDGSNNEFIVTEGLQKRFGLEQTVAGQVGTKINPQEMIQDEMQKAQAELTKLKDKINQLGGSGSDLVMPSFSPNQQKMKAFWKRWEYAVNIQSVKSSNLLPATSDIAFTAGYKLSDKSVLGIGLGYKLGWGQGIRNIHLSSEGLSLRSFIDIQFKGSFWITGGYEMNYLYGFTKIDQLKDQSAWQRSGLLGVTKKYRLAKKGGNLQLLWDFMSYSQVPRAVPLKFRVGYRF